MNITNEDLLNQLYKGYIDARKHKRNTLVQLDYEIVCEHDINNLFVEITNRTYKTQPRFCFITYDPIQREVYASQFRDCIVQHFLFNMINPLFETLFIYDTYSCRKEKGTLFGIKRYQHHLRSVTNNFQKDAYVLYLDLSGYFMSIDKNLVIDIIMKEINKHANKKSYLGGVWEDHIDADLVLFLLHAMLDPNPSHDCVKLGDPSDWDGLPDRKRLECSPEGCGVVIGDITSQMISNILLNVFDQWVKRDLKVKHYGHYVDDMYFMSESKDFLRNIKPLIKEFLKTKLYLKVNPRKWRFLKATYSTTYLGAYVRCNYAVPRKRTIDTFVRRMKEINSYLTNNKKPTRNKLEEIRTTVNAYLGLFSHYKSFKLRQKYVGDNKVLGEYFVPRCNCTKIDFVRKYKTLKCYEYNKI